MTSSPLRPGSSLEEELDYYKKQYEQLEADLADFQASSKELEEQLERDIDNAEKSERKFKEQVEKLTFEVEEWKSKHKNSKIEANNAQNALQKEITSMRDSGRTMQLRLRDIEVMNDDYEKQARNTESSLEDMEAKYNMAIERSVLLDEELRAGEQERESLRIETQRLRDELSELKVENEITREKLRLADKTIETLRSRKPSPLAVENLRARSPGSEASGLTPSSPTASTPPATSETTSGPATPPSPPLSDVAPANVKSSSRATMSAKRQSVLPDGAATPRPAVLGSQSKLMHSRGQSIASIGGVISTGDGKTMRPPMDRSRVVSRPSNLVSEGLPRSDSLYQIRSLRGRMQRIEERVHSARSKLPPGKPRTPKGSPRAGAAAAATLPASVTLRRSAKQPSINPGGQQIDAGSDITSDTPSRRRSYVKRPSFGIPRPTSVASDRATSTADRPPSAAANRPPSRLSLASVSESASAHRPSSRTGTQTSSSSHAGPSTPSREHGNSRLGGPYATVHGTPRTHRPSVSMNELRRMAAEGDESALGASPTRSNAYGTPSATLKRQSSGLRQPRMPGKRSSIPFALNREDESRAGSMLPPPRRKMDDVGETY